MCRVVIDGKPPVLRSPRNLSPRTIARNVDEMTVDMNVKVLTHSQPAILARDLQHAAVR